MQNQESRERPAYPVGAAGNALRTVQLLHEREELRVVDVAEQLGIARSTAHRVLAMLVFHGFAQQDGNKVYRPGPALRAIRGSRALPPDLIATARPHLQRLTDTVHETSHLMVLEGSGARFLDGVEGPQVLRVSYRTGTVLPAHVTSGGKALLAGLPPEQVAALYPRGLPGHSAESVERLRAELAVIRRLGYAYNLQESESGVNAVGACVRDGAGRALAAVAVAAPASRCRKTRLTELAPTVLDAARSIGREL
ncbi:IclR family transcriptional regulator [Streptomyces sp. NPDC048278]|uniref:IclR family transcriptional regulator n=1 Tax=unclassified Streptomyces TaxID=2593676 RepID=UPI003435EC8C